MLEWLLVAMAVGLLVVLVCNVADEVAFWWTLRRTDPRRVRPKTTIVVRDG